MGTRLFVTKDEATRLAKNLRKELASQNIDKTLSESQHLIAKSFGAKNFQTLDNKPIQHKTKPIAPKLELSGEEPLWIHNDPRHLYWDELDDLIRADKHTEVLSYFAEVPYAWASCEDPDTDIKLSQLVATYLSSDRNMKTFYELVQKMAELWQNSDSIARDTSYRFFEAAAGDLGRYEDLAEGHVLDRLFHWFENGWSIRHTLDDCYDDIDEFLKSIDKETGDRKETLLMAHRKLVRTAKKNGGSIDEWREFLALFIKITHSLTYDDGQHYTLEDLSDECWLGDLFVLCTHYNGILLGLNHEQLEAIHDETWELLRKKMAS